MKLLVLLSLFFSISSVQAQEPHKHPDHPKGNNSKNQYKALPLYNEACELYANGSIQKAKLALYEAINASFALTEAHLFLGMIYYAENKLDSAFVYLNSGIDFAIKQKPFYYFYLFETGMKMEQYSMVKHNLKHFKKIHGKFKGDIYDEGYPFTKDDYQLYQTAAKLVYNYNYWDPKSKILSDLEQLKKYELISSNNNKIIALKNDQLFSIRKKKNTYKKVKSLKFKEKNIESLQYIKSLNAIIFSKTENKITSIYFTKKSGSKWNSPIKLPEIINKGAWNSNPYFYEAGSLLYFSSNRSGNKDLYVAKFDLENNKCKKVEPLSIINTKYDELSPCFVNDTFYFASNGHPGFGGFDLFYSPYTSTVNKITVPTKMINMGKPYNSNEDETKIIFFENKKHIVLRENYKGEYSQSFMEFLPKKLQAVDFEIKMINLKTDDD